MNIKEKIIDYRFFKSHNETDSFQINDNDYIELLNDEDKLFANAISTDNFSEFTTNENSFYSNQNLNENIINDCYL